MEVEQLEPQNEQIKKTLDSMAERGIGYVYGRWLIEGAPRVILFDTKTAYKHLDEWKSDLWNVAMIPCPPGDDETNEAVVFGYLVAWFLGEVGLFLSGESRGAGRVGADRYRYSSLATRRPRPSSRISTSGSPVWRSHSAARDASM